MASPNPDLDVEAQTNSFTETQPANISNSPPPATTANTQIPTTGNPQPQVTNTNEHHNQNAPTRQTVDHSEVQRGVLTFPVSQVVL